jgi:hypothetical protein
VLVEHGSGPAPATDAPLVTAPTVVPPTPEFVEERSIPPVVIDVGDPNATLSAFFGPHPEVADSHRSTGTDRSIRHGTIAVESVLPQLRLLVQGRLQRSSGSVDEVVENAANDRQSVAWLADRVRVMTVRGFLHSTFDQLADDMLALADRGQD